MTAYEKYTRIKTDETLREVANHGKAEFPFAYYYENIRDFDFHCIDWHWHAEVEFAFLEKGSAKFFIGGDRFIMSEKTGIFINSKVIHRFESEGDAILPNIVFSPALLSPENSLIYEKDVRPVLDSGMDYLILGKDVPWQNEVICGLTAVFDECEAKKPSEIAILRLLLKIWGIIGENTSTNALCRKQDTPARAQAQLQIMMQYIHSNYGSRITLDSIAESVMISKSSALSIFGKYLHTSPINYLVNYRLKQAAKLLCATENGLAVIAQQTGFESVGYFCRKFKGLFGLTPSEYRKKKAVENKV